ncbi:MAG: hypothetical protein GEU92_14070 [Alphaproteobacteria bacterium]|nr:hypothetical protein [Alphaproteobacteria bacterium]
MTINVIGVRPQRCFAGATPTMPKAWAADEYLHDEDDGIGDGEGGHTGAAKRAAGFPRGMDTEREDER